VLETVVKATEREKRDRMVEAAFIGWQGYILQPRGKGKKPEPFKRWLSMMGLSEKKAPSKQEREQAIMVARQTEQRVMEVFG